MRKSIVWAMVCIMVVIGLVACSNSLESRVKKGAQKYQELTKAQKEQCGRHEAIAINILGAKTLGHNLAETKTQIQNDKEATPDIKAAATKLADLLYSNNFTRDDAVILGRVICAEDMK
jgi:hypothetical protein